MLQNLQYIWNMKTNSFFRFHLGKNKVTPNEKTMFSYSKSITLSVLLEHFIKHKPLTSEEWPTRHTYVHLHYAFGIQKDFKKNMKLVVVCTYCFTKRQ